tara:strand:+ start:232 stop:447 length:216 start_codon:yes stop_codon:yes gene_type:complete
MKIERDTSGVYEYNGLNNTMDNKHCIFYEELNYLIEKCGENGNVLMEKLIKVKQELNEPAIVSILITVKGK